MIKYILPALLSALLVSACSSSEPEFVRDASSEKKVVFSISVTQGGASATRASVGDDEKVTEVDVLAFRKENGNYYYAYHSVGSSTATDGGNIKSFTAKAYTLKGNQQFVVIANAHDEVARITANLTERDNWSKEQLLRLLQLNLGDKVWGETSGSINRFPLWGETGDMAVTATTTIPNIAQVLIRMTVRIDVALSSSAGKVFRLTSLRLYNRNTVGRIAPISTSDYWDSTGNTILKPSIAGNPSDNYKPYKVEKGPQVYTYSESTGEPAKCTIYTPEYEAPPLTDYTNAACLVIGGKYAPDGNFDAVTAESYYRIDFTETISGTVKLLDLLRNHLYEITVNSVTGSGQNDPDNAFLSKTANLDATVQPWNLVHLGDMIFDKDSYLSVKHGRMAFNQDDKRVDASLHDNVITVETDYLSTDANYPDGWYIEKVIYKGGDADKPWLTLHKVDDNSVVTVGRGTDNANVKPAKTPYSFYTKFDANNTKKERSAQFVFVAGHLSYKLTVSQAANNEVNIVLTNDAGHVLSGGDTMLFEANNNGVPAVQKLRVEWHPANYPLKVEVATVAGKGGFTTGMIKPATLSSPEGSHTYLLSPSAIESKDDNEWNGRAVTVTFTVLTAAGETTSSTKSIVLKQMNYQLTTDISESAYVMDENDGVDNFKLTTNFKWRAEFFESDNPTEKSTLVRIDEPNNAGGANSEKKNDKATVPVQFFDFLQQCADGALDLSKPLPNDAILRVWRQRDNGSEVMFGEYQMHVTLPIETVTGREITLPVTGGESDLLGVVCRSKTPERYQYKVKATINKGTRTASSTRTGGMAGVVNHTPTVTYNDKTPIPNGVLSGALPFDRKMQVTYPKLWFPNREIDGIKTTFEYYLVCPGGKDIPMPLATCVVKQAPLLPRARNAWEAAYSKDAENDKGNKRWDYDGNLDDDVFYVSYLIKNAFPGIINNGAVNGRYLGLRPQDQNRTFSYIHIAGGLYDEVTASPVRIEPKKGLIEEQWNKNEAVLWFQGDVGDQWVTQFQKAMPTGYDIETNAGKRIGSYQDVANFKLEENSAGTRIFKFVTGRFYTTSDKQITSVSFATMDNFMSNLNKWPSTMIPIAYNSERGLVAIGIDPSTKFVFVASSRLFADRSGEKQYLLFKYLVDYLVNAADYSAAFSDMLLDKVDGKDNPVCAPWDSCWGANSYPN